MLARLREQGIDPQIIQTHGPGTASDQVRAAIAAGADLILIAGGDGTVNEALNGLAGSGVPLGVLPGGTANVLCSELRSGTNMEKVAARFKEFVPVDVSLGLLRPEGREPRHFLLMAGAGLDATIVRDVSPEWKRRFGKLSYWAGGFGHTFSNLTPLNVEFEGQKHRCGFALAARVRNYGGDLEIANHADLLDHSFGLVLFKATFSLPYLLYFGGVLIGQHSRLPGVTLASPTRIRLSPASDRPVFIHVDGEDAGPLPATLEIVPEALRLMVPPGFATVSHPLLLQSTVRIPSNSV